MQWEISKSDKSGSVFFLDFFGFLSGSTARIYLGSDWHIDNAKCDRALLKQHLDKALADNVPVFSTGDIFDLMQSPGDKRRSADALFSDHLGDNYFNRVINETTRFLEPYAPVLAGWTYGNHETAMVRYHGIDPLSWVAGRLKDAGAPLQLGGYGAYIIVRFWGTKKEKEQRKHGPRARYVIRTFHGSGGGGPVTRGVIKSNRNAVIYPDADLVQIGHIHEQWQVAVMRERLDRTTGEITARAQLHISTPTYKQEYSTKPGYHTEKGRPPKPLGCYWIDMSYSGTRGVNPVAIADIKHEFQVK